MFNFEEGSQGAVFLDTLIIPKLFLLRTEQILLGILSSVRLHTHCRLYRKDRFKVCKSHRVHLQSTFHLNSCIGKRNILFRFWFQLEIVDLDRWGRFVHEHDSLQAEGGQDDDRKRRRRRRSPSRTFHRSPPLRRRYRGRLRDAHPSQQRVLPSQRRHHLETVKTNSR